MNTSADCLRRAFREGTTLPTRLFLSVAGILQGAGYLVRAPNWLSAPVYQTYNAIFTIDMWGAVYLTAGGLGLWRVFSPRSRPGFAWAVNLFVCLVWTTGLAARLLMGGTSLLSIYSAVTMMAFWCLLRTEATVRDTNTA